MLKVHQELGLIAAAPMLAALITGSGAKTKRGATPGTFVEPSSTNLDLHVALGSATTGLYFSSVYFAIRAPKVAGVKTRGHIRLHKDLAWIHGPGMILTPVLGAMAFDEENKGEKVHGIASAHGAVAVVTAGAYGAAIVAVSWPIKWKFWEGQ